MASTHFAPPLLVATTNCVDGSGQQADPRSAWSARTCAASSRLRSQLAGAEGGGPPAGAPAGGAPVAVETDAGAQGDRTAADIAGNRAQLESPRQRLRRGDAQIVPRVAEVVALFLRRALRPAHAGF